MMIIYDIDIKQKGFDKMPKRKKLPEIPSMIGLGNIDKLTVQKSNPLQSLAKTNLTLPELKILDVYLSRIDSHNPQKRTVVIEKGDLERVLGVTRILKDDLDERLEHLFQSVRIEDNVDQRGFKRIALFEEAEAIPDDNGLWTITLTCTFAAREYIFNIEDLGYLRYRLKNVIELKSRYSYVLFLYLENNRFRSSWEIKLDDLKELLNCNAETYKAFFRFNGLVLSKCHKEINKKTDCQFDYEPIKQGRAIVAVRFTVKSRKQIESEEVIEVKVPTVTENRPLWESVLKEWRLSQEKLDELSTLLDAIPDHKLPEAEYREQSKYKYIAVKVAEIKRRNQEKKINNRFAYLRTLIQKDIESKKEKESEASPAVAKGTQAFRNFTERTNNNYMEKILKQYSQ